MASSSHFAHLTPQQRSALATDKNISVTAGAGSGKTTILVERYLKIVLEEGVDVRNVLAITFTDKAAAEMTGRVAEKISSLLEESDTTWPRKRLQELRDKLNWTQISTIHGFCARILRDHAVASGIDPDFAVLTDLPRRLLIDEAIREVMTRLDRQNLESDHDLEEWRALLRQISPSLLEETFYLILENRYEVLQWRRRFAEAADSEILAGLQERFFELLEARLDRGALLNSLRVLVPALCDSGIDPESLKDRGAALWALMQEVRPLLDEEPGSPQLWQRLINLAAGAVTTSHAAYKTTASLGSAKVLGEAKETLLSLSATILPLHAFARECSSTVPLELDRAHLGALRLLLELAGDVVKHYRQLKEERGVLDFEDLQIEALRMLDEHPRVRNALRSRYRYIMVDEFQDTNALQWEIISRLGTPEGQLDPDKFFIVGDPKQSIYGFRNADVRVFRRVKEAFLANAPAGDSPGKQDIVLTESFRFNPALNRFVNRLFQDVLTVEAGNEFEVAYDHLDTRRTVEDHGAIELGFIRAGKERETALSQEDYIAARIRTLYDSEEVVYHRKPGGEVLERIRYGDIAILIPRRNQLLELEAKLRQYGIPFKTIGGVGFYRREEIFDTYHLLRYLANPLDDLAFVALLRSPFAGISDAGLFFLSLEKGDSYRDKLERIENITRYPDKDQARLLHFLHQVRRWERRRDRVSLSQLLDEIFNESFYRATVGAEWNGEQLLANIDKVVEMARDYEQGGFIALADFIASLHEIIRHDPREGEAQVALEDDSTVKVMTIHQAKGLEFPVVFCPYLEQGARIDTSKLRFDPEWGMAVKMRDRALQFQENKPFLFEWIDYRQKQKQLAELRRLFYVAVTRARDRVYLCADEKPGMHEKESPLGWTIRCLGLQQHLDGEVKDLLNPLLLDAGDGLALSIVTTVGRDMRPPVLRKTVEPGIQNLEAILNEPAPEKGELQAHLRPARDVPSGETFSATQLQTFRKDPRQYFERYHLGFFESDYEFLRQLGDADGLALLKGSIVHKLLEGGLPLSPAECRRRLKQLIFQFEVFEQEMQTELMKEIPPLVDQMQGSPFAARVFSAKDFRTEISITMQLGEDFFTGTLDRCFRNEAGIWEVVDYKTNRIKAGAVERTGATYDMQMQSYALLMSRVFREQESFPVTLYFMYPEKEYRKLYGRDEVDEIRRAFLKLISEIRHFYPFGEQML